jgi:hypothetical protein
VSRYLKCEVHGWALEKRPDEDVWACKGCYYTVPAEAVERLLARQKYWPGILVVDAPDPKTKCITCGGPVSGMSAYYCSDDNPGMYIAPPPKQITDQGTQ